MIRTKLTPGEVIALFHLEAGAEDRLGGIDSGKALVGEGHLDHGGDAYLNGPRIENGDILRNDTCMSHAMIRR